MRFCSTDTCVQIGRIQCGKVGKRGEQRRASAEGRTVTQEQESLRGELYKSLTELCIHTYIHTYYTYILYILSLYGAAFLPDLVYGVSMCERVSHRLTLPELRRDGDGLTLYKVSTLLYSVAELTIELVPWRLGHGNRIGASKLHTTEYQSGWVS